MRPFDLRVLKASLARWQAGLADVGWNSLYWDNHDQPRVVSRYGDDGRYRTRSAKMLATVLHLHRGTPCVYQGDELGMTNAPFATIDDVRDVEALNHHAAAVAAGADPDDVLEALRTMGRDNARTPMQWDGSRHAGFTTGTPWLAVNPNHVEVNAAAELADEGSVLHHYRALIALRHHEAVVTDGSYALLLPDDERVFAFTRRLADVELLVLGNFSADTVAVDLPDAAAWASSEVLLADRTVPAPAPGALTLAPWEGRVHRRTPV